MIAVELGKCLLAGQNKPCRNDSVTNDAVMKQPVMMQWLMMKENVTMKAVMQYVVGLILFYGYVILAFIVWGYLGK